MGIIIFLGLAVNALRWQSRRQAEENTKQNWDKQVAEIQAGKTTTIVWPEPKFLEVFVKDQPDVAAKITGVDFCIGKVSDERFGYLKQFPNLESINFYEVWDGADSFLMRIAGMESITSLSFCKTLLSKEGIEAVASFPNLKRLSIDWSFKDTSLKPLSRHKSIETIRLDSVRPTDEWIDVMASLPHLQELELEEDERMSAADFANLQKALPKVKLERGK
jgi:hypothetical protein